MPSLSGATIQTDDLKDSFESSGANEGCKHGSAGRADLATGRRPETEFVGAINELGEV
jgi:hypothetical protein